MAEGKVAVLVPNLFLRVAVEEAVRGVGAEVVLLADLAGAAQARCGLVIADLDALAGGAESEVRELVSSGAAVVIFGPRGDDLRLALLRRAGAVAMQRTLFLQRLPAILASARGSGGHDGGASRPR